MTAATIPPPDTVDPAAQVPDAEGPPSPSSAVSPDLTDWAPRGLPVPWRRPIAAASWGIVTAVGTAAITLLMAVVAAIPVVNFYVLGVLLDAEGRVARSGRPRDAFRLWGVAPRIGGAVLGCWLFLLPIRFLASFASDAALVDPGGPVAKRLSALTLVLTVAVVVHLLLALARGGRFSMFFRPVKNLRSFLTAIRRPSVLRRMGDHAASFGQWFDFGRLWWLGLRGFGVAFAWLVFPTALYVSAENPEGGELLLVAVGFLLLTTVNCWLPLLQANFAAGGRLRDGFALRTVRQQFNAAPWAWLLAIVVLYLLTLPLHLFRIVLPPADAAWLVTLVFVATIFPTRIIVGWAAFKARVAGAAGDKTRWWNRFSAKLLLVLFVAVYTAILFLTQYIGTHGRAVLFEQHAFLLPWPL